MTYFELSLNWSYSEFNVFLLLLQARQFSCRCSQLTLCRISLRLCTSVWHLEKGKFLTNNLTWLRRRKWVLWLQIVTPIVREALVPSAVDLSGSAETPVGCCCALVWAVVAGRVELTLSGLVVLKTTSRTFKEAFCSTGSNATLHRGNRLRECHIIFDNWEENSS